MISPDISVIVPIYGVEKYIEKSLRSLFSQTKTDGVEFILVNDCTPDRTMEVAREVIADFPTLDIKIVDHEVNRGVAAARQTGLDTAKSLANSIVELLNRSDNNDLQMLSFIKDNFSFDVVIETWEEFLLSVDDKIPHSPKDREYPYFCLKPIKRLMRSLKLKCKLLRKIPSVQGLLNVWGRVIEKNNIHNYG